VLGVRAERVPLRQEEVRIGVLSCTLTIPPGDGRRAAVAFAHGAGPALRAWTSTQALFLNRLGLITLACDKRGIGQSGGRYPGEFPSAQAVDRYARDVEALARFLAAQPEVDPARVGLMGASQAGWIMPLAAVREPAIRFVVGLVPPTLSQGETDLWADLSGDGAALPTLTDAEIEARVRAAGPSGVDPRPAIRELRIPVVWLYGGKDRIVPTRLCVEWLDPLTREAGRDVSYAVFPGGGHALIETANDLSGEALRSHRFVPGYHATIRDWLRARGFAS
jgi:pimeloyl-ACP methyl ester carboxylesterase